MTVAIQRPRLLLLFWPWLMKVPLLGSVHLKLRAVVQRR